MRRGIYGFLQRPVRKLNIRRFSTETTNSNQMSNRNKGLLFSFVSLSAVSGGFIYNLHADKDFLVATHEKLPWLINTIGPYVGLPVSNVEEAPVLDFPEELSDIIGESVTLCCLLQSGQVVTVQASPNDTIEQIRSDNNITEPIINYEVVNAEDEGKAEESKRLLLELDRIISNEMETRKRQMEDGDIEPRTLEV